MSTHLWQLWPGRHWPLLRDEEATFVAELAERSTSPRKPFDRGDLIAVVNAIRCGISVEDLLGAAPGLDPTALLVAYEHVDARRAEAATAWKQIVADPSIASITMHGPAASKLVPVPIYRITSNANNTHGKGLEESVVQAAAQMALISSQSLAIENHLRQITPPSEEGVALGRCLYDPYDPQLWGHPYYLPERVGTLMPIRVADLLGEGRR